MPGTVQSTENVATSKADAGACPHRAQALEKRDDQCTTYRSKLDSTIKKGDKVQWRKNEARQRTGNAGGPEIRNREAKEGFTEKVTSEQNLWDLGTQRKGWI